METEKGLLLQRRQAAREAEAMVKLCVSHEATLQSIVWSAAREGLWDSLAPYLDQDETAFIGPHEATNVEFASHFAVNGDFGRAERIAATITEPEVRNRISYRFALAAAERGAHAHMHFYMSQLDDSQKEAVHDSYNCCLVAENRWDEFFARTEAGGVNSDSLFQAVAAAAQTGAINECLRCLRTVYAQDPEAYDESLNQAVRVAVQNAYKIGQLGFIAELQHGVAWPEHSRQSIGESITLGIVFGAEENKEYATAISLFAIAAIEHGAEGNIYQLAETAYAAGDWEAIGLIADKLNSETLGVLYRAAYDAGASQAMTVIRRAWDTKPKYEGNYIFMSDDSAPVLQAEANKGVWDTALDMVDGPRGTFWEENVLALIPIAVSQQRADILLRLCKNSSYCIGRAVEKLHERGDFQLAATVFEAWKQQCDDPAVYPDIPYRERWDLMNRAQFAAYFADWDLAIETLDKLDTSPSPNGFEWHRGYEFVAIEALRLLRAAQRTQSNS